MIDPWDDEDDLGIDGQDEGGGVPLPPMPKPAPPAVADGPWSLFQKEVPPVPAQEVARDANSPATEGLSADGPWKMFQRPVDSLGLEKPPSAPKVRASERSSFAPDVDDAITRAATEHGIDADMLRTFARIESSGNPTTRTGSYKGLFQLSDAEFSKLGGRDIYDAWENSNAAAVKFKAESADFQRRYGRQPTTAEMYLIHQQGIGGADAHWRNPDAPAWENMASTAEGRQKGPAWAKQAIWGNVPNDVKRRYGSVENMTSRDFVDLWNTKVERFGGTQVAQAGPKATASDAPSFGDILALPPEQRADALRNRMDTLGVKMPERPADQASAVAPVSADAKPWTMFEKKPETSKVGDGIVAGLTDPQQYKEFAKGVVPGAIKGVGTGISGLTTFDVGEQMLGRIAKYRDRLATVPTMTDAEVGAFIRDVNKGEDARGVAASLVGIIRQMRQNPETTLDEIKKQFPDAIPTQERILFKAGEIVKEYGKDFAPAAPGYDQAVGRQLGEGLGSMGVGLALAPFGALPAGVAFMSMGAGEALDNAVEFDKKERKAGRKGLTEEQINTAGLLGIGPGATDLVPIEIMMGRLRIPQPLQKVMASAVARIGGQAFVEGVQEGGQQFLQNLIQKQVYNPDKALSDEVLGNIGIGAGVGGIAQTGKEVGGAALRLAGRRGGRGSAGNAKEPEPLLAEPMPPQPTTEQAPTSPDAVAPPPLPGRPGTAPAWRPGEGPTAEEADVLRQMGFPDDVIVEMSPEQRAGELDDARAMGLGPAPAGTSRRPPPLGRAEENPTAEPLGDLVAQSRDLADPDHDRRGIYLSQANLDNLQNNPDWVGQLAAVLDNEGDIIDNVDGKGGMLLTKDAATAAAVRRAVDRGADLQAILGGVTGAGQGKPANASAVVQQVMPDGAVTRESAVAPDQVAATQEAFQAPGRDVRTLPLEEAMARRENGGMLPEAQTTPPPLPVGDGSRSAPVKATASEHVEQAAARAADPTDAQKDAGNYQKGHIDLGGLPITIENAKGSTRSGTSPDGTSWQVTMPAHYGYVKGTRGRDGDQVDVYVGDDPGAQSAYVVDQIDADTGRFDEHKVMLGFPSRAAAISAYTDAFSDGRGMERVGGVSEMSLDEFKGWLDEGRRTQPVSDLSAAPTRQPEDNTRGPSEPLTEDEIESLIEAWRYVKTVDEQVKAGKNLADEQIDIANELDADLHSYGVSIDDQKTEEAVREHIGGAGPSSATGPGRAESQEAPVGQRGNADGGREGSRADGRSAEVDRPSRYEGDPLTAEQIDTLVDAWKYVQEVYRRPKPVSLTSFIISEGGVRDDAREVRHIAGEAKQRPGLISKDGKYLDDVALRAWEAGFFTDAERPTIADLLNKLQNDLHTGLVVRLNDEVLLEDIAVANEMARELADYGVTTNRFRTEATLREYFGQDRPRDTGRAAQGEAVEQAASARPREADPDQADAVDIPFDTQAPETGPSDSATPVVRADDQLHDYAGVTINDYEGAGDGRNDRFGGSVKRDFLSDARNYLTKVAKELKARGFEPHPDKRGKKEKPGRAVSVNPGGPAVSGDVTLAVVDQDGNGVYAQIGTALAGPNGGISLMARAASKDNRYGTRSTNQWLSPNLTVKELADRLERIARPMAPVTAEASGQTSLVPEATTKEKIAAEAKKKDDRGKATADADAGELFNPDAGKQTDLVDMAKAPDPRDELLAGYSIEELRRIANALQAGWRGIDTREDIIRSIKSRNNTSGDRIADLNAAIRDAIHDAPEKPADTYSGPRNEWSETRDRLGMIRHDANGDVAGSIMFDRIRQKRDPKTAWVALDADGNVLGYERTAGHAKDIVEAHLSEPAKKPATVAAETPETSAEQPAKEPDTETWLAEREKRIKESKAEGNKHLDQLPRGVEGMRGVEFHNVHDPKEHGVVRTVSNRGDVVVNWADKYSADKNLVDEKTKDGKNNVWQSWLAPTDLKDYVVGRGDEADLDLKDKDTAGPLTAIRDRLLDPDGGFDTIVEARKFAREHGITGANKAIDEAIEVAVVDAARVIVQERGRIGTEPGTIYQGLVRLYDRQPNLASRTGTSVANQAYSTPMPLAYLASRLAGVATADSVYEPTAGNGALLIEVKAKGKARVNELDPRRAEALRAQGFTVTEEDGSAVPTFKDIDSVIMNPPFGAVKEGGKSKEFQAGGLTTTQIDHAVAINGLEAMADDGRAVLILGGIKAKDTAERRKGYRGQAKREFYYRLYNQYNVTDHFTVSGDLYKKQGAGWPVDVIVIDGRGKSERPLPASSPPTIFETWDALAEKLTNAGNDRAVDQAAGRPVEPVGQPDGRDAGSRKPAAGARSEQPASEPEAGSPRVRPDAARGQSGDAGASAPGERRGDATRSDRDGGRTDQPPAASQPRVRAERKAPPKGSGQANYEAASTRANSLDTLIPVNMADAAKAAMQRVAERHGSVDDLVAERLGYKKDDLAKYFSAEQVDAVAAAIDNADRGAAMIIGDQTGIGKGRIAAGMLRYAMKQGMIPVFVTEKPDLYGDMFRDLRDIGVPEMLGREPSMFITNAGASIPLDEEALAWKQEADLARENDQKVPPRRGKFLTGGTSEKILSTMRKIASGDADVGAKGMPDVVFTTYDQMATVKGQDTDRRRFISRIADRSFLVFDESHNAGGAAKTGWEKKDATPNRSDFVRDIAKRAKGVMFSSATYAKRPDVMDLYARTDMGRAVEDPKLLPALIQRGGVPMQQIVASMLADSGQYLRRERSFEGVEYAVEGVPVNQKSYRQFSDAVRAIFKFDLAVKDARKEIMEDLLDAKGMAMSKDSGVGESAAHTTAFAGIMHNVVNQMLLAIKAGQAAKRAIAATKAGEKPVIALANTNESFIKDFAEQENVALGQALDMDFGEVLRRYLARTLRVTIKHPDKTKEHVDIPVERLPTGLQRMYHDALSAVNEGAYEGMPISPIDWVRHEVTQAGLKVAEVTGRQTMIDYGSKTPKYVARPKSEMGPAGKRGSIAAFNRGALDVLILNRSGSTGVSMHASKDFRDQRRRRMIIAQAEGNIDTHLQMLGRVHRTGQVIPPAYSQIAAEIPAEARPTAVLMRKMASLNANTTGARGSVFMADSVDFMNEVGDKVVADLLLEDSELDDELGGALKVDNDGIPVSTDAAKRATGRLVLLDPAKQADFLERVQKSYKSEVEQLDALGENPLEAKTLDLQAKTLDTTVLKPKQGESPFLDEVRVEKVSVKAQGRAMKPSDIAGKIAETIKATKSEGTDAVALRDLEGKGRAWKDAKVRETLPKAQDWIRTDIADLSPDAKVSTRKRHEQQVARWVSTMNTVYPGARVTLQMPAGDMDGIVMSVERTGKAKLPVALGSWEARIAVPDGAREFIFPFSKLFPESETKSDDEKGAAIAPSPNSTEDMVALFEEARKDGRETRYMVTGNILGGFDQVAGKGRIVNYTTESGEIRPGVFMGREFELKKFMGARAIRFQAGEQVAAFIDKIPAAEVKDTDGDILIKRFRGAFSIEMPASRSVGGKYFTDPEVRKALGGQDFEKRGNKMVAGDLPRAALVRAVDAMRKVGAIFETREAQDEAQAIIGNGSETDVSPALSTQEIFSARRTALDFIRRRLASGQSTRISEAVLTAQIDAARPYFSLLPAASQVGVLSAVAPLTEDEANANAGTDAVASFRLVDGEIIDIPVSLGLLERSRALYDNITGHVLLVGLSRGEIGEKFGVQIATRIHHEAVHARWRGLPVDVRDRLARHADLLGVLDMQLGTVLDAVGEPYLKGDVSALPLRDLYTALNKGSPNFQDKMVQESVAHLRELQRAGFFTPAELEAIQDDLALLDGAPARPPVEGFPVLNGLVSMVSIGGSPNAAITAYHGTPHDFDRFSMDKIGTGEGAQAYGYGLYFAENEGVARGYRDRLSGRELGSLDDATKAIAQAVGTGRDAVAEEIVSAQGRRRWQIFDQEPSGFFRRGKRRSIGFVDETARGFWPHSNEPGALERLKKDGHLYEVRINAEPEQFLDWDKPLSQQSEAVRKALPIPEGSLDPHRDQLLAALGKSPQPRPDYDAMLAGDFIRDRRLPGPRLEDTLKAAGIPGIRYKDAGSRRTEGGTYNYVVFDDALIEITAKNGEKVSPEERAAVLKEIIPPTAEKIAEQGQPMFSAVPHIPVVAQARLAADLTDAINIVSRIAGKKVKVEFRDTINVDSMVPAETRGGIEHVTGERPTTAGGFYQSATLDAAPLIALATNATGFDLRTTAGHEAWHHVETALATPAELKLLNSPAEMKRMLALVAQEIGSGTPSPEEIRAIAFQRYRRMREEGLDGASGLHIGIRRFFDRVARIFQSAVNAMLGRGYDSYESIFERARTGEMAGRGERAESRQPLPSAPLGIGQELPDQAGSQSVIAPDAQGNGNSQPDADQNDGRSVAHRSPEKASAFLDRMAKSRRVGVLDYDPFDKKIRPFGYDSKAPFRINDIDPNQIMRRGVQTVPLDKIRTEQPVVSVKGVKEKLTAPDGSQSVPQVIKHGDLYWISEGNHRVTAAWARGQTHVRVAVGEIAGANDAAAEVGDRLHFSIIPTAVRIRANRIVSRVSNNPSVDRAREYLQDKVLPIRRVQGMLEQQTGMTIADGQNIYQAEAIFHGRVGERVSDLQQDMIEPMLQRMRRAGISAEEFGDYLYARHAAERNAAIAVINPQMTSGSGMSNADANAILARAGARQADYDAIAGMFDAMQADTRNTLLRSGLIDRETYDNWSNQYQHYAPLRGFEVSEDDTGQLARTGRGFDIKGREAMQALGRRSKADNPFAYGIQQAMQAVIRAEKNRVDKALYRAVQTYPEPDLWQVFRGEQRRRINPQTGLVETYWLPPAFAARNKDNVFGVKIAGKQHYVEVHHPGMARALRGAGIDAQGSALGRAFYKLARTYASLLTSYNPEFVVSNYFRDLETAMMNLGDVADKPPATRRKILAEALSLKSIRGVMAALQSHEGRTIFGTLRAADETAVGTRRTAAAQEYARWFDEFRLAGGKISFLDGMNDIDRIKRKVERSVSEGRTMRAIKGVGRIIDNLNASVENGVRLSTYIALRKNGVSQDRAAFAARELTVNFNRKGQWSPGINAAYLFFNASVQGTTRLAQALTRSRTVQAGVAGLFAAGMMLDWLNYWGSGDDDDGENAYEKIKPWIKEKNMIVMLPGRKDYVMIPMAYGYNVPYLAGQNMGALIRSAAGAGKAKPLESVLAVLGAATESFSPLGAAASFGQLVAPTMLDPVMQITENKNWFGGQIQPTKFDARKPDSENFFSTAPTWAIDFARTMNRWSGGNRAEAGKIDVSPETLEHFVEFAGGGVSKFVGNLWATGERAAKGDEWIPEKTPFVRRVYGKATSESRRADFYEAWNKIDGKHNAMTLLAKGGDREAALKIRAENAPELRAWEAMSATQKQLAGYRKQRDQVNLDRALDKDEKKRRIDEITKKENGLILKALGVYSRAKKDAMKQKDDTQ